jgi:hypothetical protein
VSGGVQQQSQNDVRNPALQMNVTILMTPARLDIPKFLRSVAISRPENLPALRGPAVDFDLRRTTIQCQSRKMLGRDDKGDMVMSKVENPVNMEYPKIVSRAEWLSARKELLIREKALTRYRDAVNSERRRLPMVRIEKDYTFDGPAFGRLEDWEEPPGRSDGPFMHWIRHHDRYERSPGAASCCGIGKE